MNFLEQMVSEWLEYQGYFVRRNVTWAARRKAGTSVSSTWSDFHPTKRHLVHYEPSMDASSWEKRAVRYEKKFAAGRKHIPELFSGFQPLPEIEQIALFGFGGPGPGPLIGGGRVVLIRDWIQDVLAELKTKPFSSHAVPEQFICLRTAQFVLHAGGVEPRARPATAAVVETVDRD